ncbi:unnamed protein product [Protopolystoma xenopodis]|uniref:Uncharacterized protein n=1 Tax=Protopolystoma xenopodis TaxID=117903 RepID=A0A3S5AKP3_9PLAT|nr:unnamed protein product [Protopolystoma xenopodis]
MPWRHSVRGNKVWLFWSHPFLLPNTEQTNKVCPCCRVPRGGERSRVAGRQGADLPSTRQFGSERRRAAPKMTESRLAAASKNKSGHVHKLNHSMVCLCLLGTTAQTVPPPPPACPKWALGQESRSACCLRLQAHKPCSHAQCM